MDIPAVEKLVELIKVTDDKEVREILLCGLERQLNEEAYKTRYVPPTFTWPNIGTPTWGGTNSINCGSPYPAESPSRAHFKG